MFTREERVDLSADDQQRGSKRGGQLQGQTGETTELPLAAGITPSQLVTFIDHTLLKPEASLDEIKELVCEAKEYGFFAVCVNSGYVRHTKNLLRGSDVKLCSVVGFPLGTVSPEMKAIETRHAIREGADEIDMVLNPGALKSGDHAWVEVDIRGVVDACKEQGKRSKVILETSLLTDQEKVQACRMSMKAGADFVKTSTGFSSGGATVQDVALMSSVAPGKLGVKASGGLRTYSDALNMIQAGATRIGTSKSVAIVKEAQALAGG